MHKEMSFFYSQDELDKFVHICNNVFYNNYLENGELNNPVEIEQKIKTEICNSLVNFGSINNIRNFVAVRFTIEIY